MKSPETVCMTNKDIKNKDIKNKDKKCRYNHVMKNKKRTEKLCG